MKIYWWSAVCSFQCNYHKQNNSQTFLFSNVTFQVPLSLVSRGVFHHQSQTCLQQFSLFTSQPLPGHWFQHHFHKNIRLVTPKPVQPLHSSVSVKEKKEACQQIGPETQCAHIHISNKYQYCSCYLPCTLWMQSEVSFTSGVKYSWCIGAYLGWKWPVYCHQCYLEPGTYC